MPTLSGKAALDAAKKLDLNLSLAGPATLQRADVPTQIPITGTVTIGLNLAEKLDEESVEMLSLEITDEQAAQLGT